MVEARKIQSGVYLGRTLLPPSHRGIAVSIVNTTDKPVRLRSDTFLGRIAPVEVVSEQQEEVRSTSTRHPEPLCQNNPDSNVSRMRKALKTRVVKETSERLSLCSSHDLVSISSG